MLIPTLERWLGSIWSQSPIHLLVETILAIALVILLLRKPEPVHDDADDLTEEEEEQIIAEWKARPKQLIPDADPETTDASMLEAHEVQSGPSDTIMVDGKECINMGTPNFYGLSMKPEIVEAALAAVDKYAVGTCGPRQFYGTMDVHLELEAAMAKFLGTEDSVNYCYPFATTTSVVQAFVHNTDVVFIDEGAWFAVQLGGELSRAKCIKFKHNDMGDLREKVASTKKGFKRWEKCNRWVVVEGLYANDGSVLDLPALVAIRKEFCLRIIVDETMSIGALGKTGRGICEEYDVPRSMIEVGIGSYGTTFASLGGFTVATKELCSHQRLASHAYIFSASPPSFNCVAATKAIQIAEQDGEEMSKKLHESTKKVRKELMSVEGFEVIGDERSPLVHLRLTEAKETVHEEDVLLQKICDECLNAEVPTAIAKSKFIRGRDKTAPRPTLKIYVSAAHSDKQLNDAVATIKASVSKVMSASE